jgi:hypothetical protein
MRGIGFVSDESTDRKKRQREEELGGSPRFSEKKQLCHKKKSAYHEKREKEQYKAAAFNKARKERLHAEWCDVQLARTLTPAEFYEARYNETNIGGAQDPDFTFELSSTEPEALKKDEPKAAKSPCQDDCKGDHDDSCNLGSPLQESCPSPARLFDDLGASPPKRSPGRAGNPITVNTSDSSDCCIDLNTPIVPPVAPVSVASSPTIAYSPLKPCDNLPQDFENFATGSPPPGKHAPFMFLSPATINRAAGDVARQLQQLSDEEKEEFEHFDLPPAASAREIYERADALSSGQFPPALHRTSVMGEMRSLHVAADLAAQDLADEEEIALAMEQHQEEHYGEQDSMSDRAPDEGDEEEDSGL